MTEEIYQHEKCIVAFMRHFYPDLEVKMSRDQALEFIENYINDIKFSTPKPDGVQDEKLENTCFKRYIDWLTSEKKRYFLKFIDSQAVNRQKDFIVINFLNSIYYSSCVAAILIELVFLDIIPEDFMITISFGYIVFQFFATLKFIKKYKNSDASTACLERDENLKNTRINPDNSVD
jgi:hypothetical protein